MGLGGFFFFSKVELGLYYLLAGVDEFLRHKWFFFIFTINECTVCLNVLFKEKNR